ncbi:MAG: hypothetical protein PHG67_06910 [Bacteroidales bacterium]|nr:hypothetical protein [Bacteroidales bacterium]
MTGSPLMHFRHNALEIDGHYLDEVTVFPNPFKNDLFLSFNLKVKLV